jgi:hypothetical protein
MKKVSKVVQAFPLICIMLILTLNISTCKCESQTFVFSDDFSTDSGMWEFLGSAYRDSVNQYIVLTEPVDWISGVVFFKVPFVATFTANFSYKAGGGSGADGFAVFFHKQKYSSFSYGSTLAFNDIYPNGTYKIIPGYGIEFDNWCNIEQPGMTEHADPSANHIALIKDHAGNHLIYVDDSRTEDNVWHNVSLTVGWSSIRVLVDEDLVFQWNGIIDRTFDSFGFCSGTGAANNWHIIDNFSIEIPACSLTITTTTGGTTTPAAGSYTYTTNSTVQVTAIPDTSYLFDHWELDNVNVGSANPYTVLMDKNHTLKAFFSRAPPLLTVISPLLESILVGHSITFTSTVSGGFTPYNYQWYLNGNPVSGATSTSWTFTPATSGIYYVYLKVTDGQGNMAQSETARINVAAVPVGGYSISIQPSAIAKPATSYIIFLAILTAIFAAIKRKTDRKPDQSQ